MHTHTLTVKQNKTKQKMNYFLKPNDFIFFSNTTAATTTTKAQNNYLSKSWDCEKGRSEEE